MVSRWCSFSDPIACLAAAVLASVLLTRFGWTAEGMPEALVLELNHKHPGWFDSPVNRDAIRIYLTRDDTFVEHKLRKEPAAERRTLRFIRLGMVDGR